MQDIGKKCNTDKVTHHHYERFYPEYLEPFLSKKEGALLEIGVDKGSSMKLWQEYLPNLFVYGVDIGVSDSGDNYHIFQADQSSPSHLDLLVNKLREAKRPLWIVNDDGSHIPEHQILTFNKLFPVLEAGGVYIIEDIETSYWSKGGLYGYPTKYGYLSPKSLIEKSKDILDFINREYLSSERRQSCISRLEGSGFLFSALEEISTIAFGHNCILFRKKVAGTPMLENRPYRFSHNL